MKKKYDHTYPERNRKKTDTYNLAAQAADTPATVQF